eukprot:COSAG06_NODE_3666_length_5043_cov_7.418689_4_plen_183_part_00
MPSGPGAPLRRVAGEDELPAPSGAAGASDEAAAAVGAAGRGKDRRAEQLEGPPGTAILYDARTWHRQHANLSDKPRTALLFVYTPRWILPMGNLTLHFDAFLSFVLSLSWQNDDRASQTKLKPTRSKNSIMSFCPDKLRTASRNRPKKYSSESLWINPASVLPAAVDTTTITQATKQTCTRI